MNVPVEGLVEPPPRVRTRTPSPAPAAASEVAPRPGALRPPRNAVNSRLPFWLVVLGLALVLGAFSRGEEGAGGARRDGDALAFDLGGLPATGSGGYTASRPSNRALALLQSADGRSYVPYGPLDIAADEGAGVVAGVLVGERSPSDAGGVPISAAADAAVAVAVHEFSLESGTLRVSHQAGPFDPARFAGRVTPGRSRAATPAAGGFAPTPARAGHFEGRLSDDSGSSPAGVTFGADGGLLLAADNGCSLHGRTPTAAVPAPALREVEAVFGAGCSRVGDVLHGHLFALAGSGADLLFVVLADADMSGGAVFSGQRR